MGWWWEGGRGVGGGGGEGGEGRVVEALEDEGHGGDGWEFGELVVVVLVGLCLCGGGRRRTSVVMFWVVLPLVQRGGVPLGGGWGV